MRPSEVRERVLGDHEAIRERLGRLETLLDRVHQGSREADWSELRRVALELLERLRTHMRWEDRYLIPALREADAWGEERAARLRADHGAQRDQHSDFDQRLSDRACPNSRVASDVSRLIELLREDMREEERDLLDARVLRDDVIAIDAEAG